MLAASQPNSFKMSSCLQLQVTRGSLRYIWCYFNCKSHLVIDCDELSDWMKQILAREHMWSSWLCYHQVQCCLLGNLAMLLCFLPCIPNRTWDRPVMLRYVFFFTSLLVELVMLTDMNPTGWITTYVKCLPFPLCLGKLCVVSCWYLWVPYPCWMTDDLPAWCAPSSPF